MNWKLALTALLASPGISLFACAQNCNPKPIPDRDIKFSDIGGDGIHNFELHGNARIVEPAPDGIPRALRIDQLHSYALLKSLDISPSSMKDATMAIGVYIESIRPAIPGAPNPNQKESYGWVMSHDNGGYDRAIFLHDERFNGVGMSVGYIPNAEPLELPLQEWIQVVAVWRQGGECSLFIQNEKVDFTEAVIGKNNDGLDAVAIGAPQLRKYGKENDNDFWIKDVKIFNYALSDQEVEDLNCDFVETLEPTIDCGQGGAPVYSCTECVSGDGSASGCSGQCLWQPVLPSCIEKIDNPDDTVDRGVSCGDHDAATCSQCGGGSSGCSGECTLFKGSCRPVDWINTQFGTNVALGKPTSQSSTFEGNNGSSVAVDGKVGPSSAPPTEKGLITHTNNDHQPWWQVSLGALHYISHIVIYNRRDNWKPADTRLAGFRVEVLSDANAVVWTYNDTTPPGQDPGFEIVLHVPRHIKGTKVKVSIPGRKEFLHLREVQVYGNPIKFTNVALGKPTSQSSTFEGNNGSSVAVDGKVGPSSAPPTEKGLITHTKEDYQPWWQVSLGDLYYISHIVIYNRRDNWKPADTRLAGFRVEVINHVGSTVWTYNDTTPSGQDPGFKIRIPTNIEGFKVKVSIPGRKEFLHLREVQVYGAIALL